MTSSRVGGRAPRSPRAHRRLIPRDEKRNETSSPDGKSGGEKGQKEKEREKGRLLLAKERLRNKRERETEETRRRGNERARERKRK